MSRCKYCGCEIPNGYFCCRTCWNDFEEDTSSDDDFDNEEEIEEEDES